jgi:hypothetical protein
MHSIIVNIAMSTTLSVSFGSVTQCFSFTTRTQLTLYMYMNQLFSGYLLYIHLYVWVYICIYVSYYKMRSQYHRQWNAWLSDMGLLWCVKLKYNKHCCLVCNMHSFSMKQKSSSCTELSFNSFCHKNNNSPCAWPTVQLTVPINLLVYSMTAIKFWFNTHTTLSQQIALCPILTNVYNVLLVLTPLHS